MVKHRRPNMQRHKSSTRHGTQIYLGQTIPGTVTSCSPGKPWQQRGACLQVWARCSDISNQIAGGYGDQTTMDSASKRNGGNNRDGRRLVAS